MTTRRSRVFRGGDLLQIALPLGGIGAGCVSLNGYGGIQDFAIRNKPAITALPDGHHSNDSAFALVRVSTPDGAWTRLVEGPLPVEKIYDQGLQGQGYRKGGQEGLPRFAECTFEGAFPFGQAHLKHPGAPVSATVCGWSPFIPGDDVASGLPAAILEYTFRNETSAPVTVEFSYHISHWATGKTLGLRGTRNRPIDGGALLYNAEPDTHETFGSAALVALSGDPRIKAMWFRGGWFDCVSALWREVSEGGFTANDGNETRAWDGGNGASIQLSAQVEPGTSVTFPIALCWHFPNVAYAVGNLGDPMAEGGPAWRPFYAGQFADAGAVADHVRDNYGELRRRTVAFQDALFVSTIPASVMDAVSANLGILKSPTVLRQENGNVWGWEGCFTASGCCHGTCTHVWNYAQALPHLFPKLERTLREQEYQRSMDERGHVNFRAALPDGPTRHDYHAASDGQLGGLLKLYRDWQISGDTEWLKSLLPAAIQSLNYCIALWDPDRQGLLFEPHHNTYDIEFWGPDGMCSSVYLGALSALSRMATATDWLEGSLTYRALAEKGGALMDTTLWNGGYYEQKVEWRDLRDQSFARSIAEGSLLSPNEETPPEVMALLRAEGPKYQYGTGCLSDGVIGAWMADFYGVPIPLEREKVRGHLQSIFRHNFKADLSDHACTQRPGYAVGKEAGLLLCSWPNGGKPTLPFPYSDEVWTGIEYQVAAHLIHEGFFEEGVALVDAVRARYDGRTRNPWNEYECGNFYARALASYALLQAFSGFRYSKVDRVLEFAPRMPGDFETFFSTDGAWGTIRESVEGLAISVTEGKLAVDRLHWYEREVDVNGVAEPGNPLLIPRA